MVCVSAALSLYTYIYTYISISMSISISVYVCMYVSIYMYIYMYVYVCVGRHNTGQDMHTFLGSFFSSRRLWCDGPLDTSI